MDGSIAGASVRLHSATWEGGPRTLERGTTEVLQGLRGAEDASRHLALAARILCVLERCPEARG